MFDPTKEVRKGAWFAALLVAMLLYTLIFPISGIISFVFVAAFAFIMWRL